MLEILIAYIKATFENSMPNITEVQGLAEKITDGEQQYPALYCTGGEYKHLSALENYLYFRQTGSATEEESEEESTSGCAYMIRRTYPMVAVAYIPKSVYNTDNAFIDGKIAQNIANIITKANWQSLGVTLKTENIYAEVGEINTNRHEVWASEYRGVDFAARLDHVFVSVEFDIVVEASETCLQNYDCNDAEIVIEGDTIIVEISDPAAWHKDGDFLTEVKQIGSLNNHDWQLIRGGVVIATVQAAGLKLDVLNAKANPGTIFLTTDNGVIKSRTAAQVRTDIGAGTVTSVGLQAGTSGTDVNITGSPVTGAGIITINIPDASAANRGLVTIGAQTFAGVKTLASAPILSGFTQGSVLFAGVGGVVSQSANLVWDNTNKRLGVRISVPIASLHVVGSGITNTTVAFTVQDANFDNMFRVIDNRTYFFEANASASYVNLGTAPLSVGLRFGGSTATTMYVTGVTPTAENVSGADGIFFGSKNSSNSNYSKLWLGFAPGVGFNNVGASSHAVTISGDIFPTSGSSATDILRIRGIINQTGTANGITRGLYINPTLTAATDFRAMETSGGKIMFGGTGVHSYAVLHRPTTTQRDAFTNLVAGAIIYNSTLNKLQMYNGASWETITSV